MIHLINNLWAIEKIKNSQLKAETALSILKRITGMDGKYAPSVYSKEFENAVYRAWHSAMADPTDRMTEMNLLDILKFAGKSYDSSDLNSKAGLFRVIVNQVLPAIAEVSQMSEAKPRFAFTSAGRAEAKLNARAFNYYINLAKLINSEARWSNFVEIAEALLAIYEVLGV